MKNAWISIAYTSGAKIYSLVIGLIMLSVTARLLGPEGRGQVAVITTWVSIFSTFMSLSLGQVALHRMVADTDRGRFGVLLGSLILLTALLTTAGWIIGFVLYGTNTHGIFKDLPLFALFIGFLTLPFMVWEQYSSSLLMGVGRIGIYNWYQVAGRTAMLLVVVILIYGVGIGVVGVLAANLLGQIIVAAGGIGVLLNIAKQTESRCKPDIVEIASLLMGGAKLHLNAIGAMLTASASILIINEYHGVEQAGYYQLAVQLMSVLGIIPVSASMVIYGKVTALGPDKAWPENKKLLVQLTLVMILIGGVAALIAPWLIKILAGEMFKPSVEPFQLMLLGLVGATFSIIMSPQWIGRGYFLLASGLTLFVGCINLIANFMLIPRYGISGAVYAYIGTNVTSIIGNGAMAYYCQNTSTKMK